jgi:hypothetical protein
MISMEFQRCQAIRTIENAENIRTALVISLALNLLNSNPKKV